MNQGLDSISQHVLIFCDIHSIFDFCYLLQQHTEKTVLQIDDMSYQQQGQSCKLIVGCSHACEVEEWQLLLSSSAGQDTLHAVSIGKRLRVSYSPSNQPSMY